MTPPRGRPLRDLRARTPARRTERSGFPGSKAVYAPSVEAVLEAVSSLYADQIKPFGRLIIRRLRESFAAEEARARGLSGQPATDAMVAAARWISPEELRRTCGRSRFFRVQPEDGQEYSVLLLDRADDCFVDPTSTCDPYPAELWGQVGQHIHGLQAGAQFLPGGRYACARELQSRGAAWTVGYSLGQLCHIVQLSIVQRRILGYLDGSLVPFPVSENCTKERLAAHHAPAGRRALRNATWEEARNCLHDLLIQHGPLDLSKVKHSFRNEVGLELSETRLGHQRLSDLLWDERLRGVCEVQLGRGGQLVLYPASGYAQWPVPDAVADCAPVAESTWGAEWDWAVAPGLPTLADPHHEVRTGTAAGAWGDTAASPTAMDGCFAGVSEAVREESEKPCDVSLLLATRGRCVKNTFIDVDPGKDIAGTRRSASVPAEFESNKNRFETMCHSLLFSPSLATQRCKRHSPQEWRGAGHAGAKPALGATRRACGAARAHGAAANAKQRAGPRGCDKDLAGVRGVFFTEVPADAAP